MYLIKYKEEKPIDLTNNVDLNYRLVNEIDPINEDDESNIDTWFKLIGFIQDDYIKMRDFAKTKFIPEWNNLTEDEKYKLLFHHIYPIGMTNSEIYSIISESEFFECWILLAKCSKICRDDRWEKARRKVSFYLNELQSLDLYNSTKNYSLEYKDANIPNLICWIKNSAIPSLGIDFTNDGFAQKPYYTEDLRNLLVSVIEYGNY
jgi:hypothetical protein